jgi:hypothetical protein
MIVKKSEHYNELVESLKRVGTLPRNVALA